MTIPTISPTPRAGFVSEATFIGVTATDETVPVTDPKLVESEALRFATTIDANESLLLEIKFVRVVAEDASVTMIRVVISTVAVARRRTG